MDSKPSLSRQLGFFGATALVISNMVGTGIFATTGFMAGDLGSARLILACWAVGALFALAGALSYAELGTNMPRSGAEFVYLSQAFGPAWGFMTGWTSFFAGFSAPIAAAALVFSDYLGYFFPILRKDAFVIGWGALTLRIGAAQIVAAALIASFTLLNCFGLSRTAKVQNVLTTIKVLVVSGLVIAGFAVGSGSWAHLSQTASRTSNLTLPAQFFVSLLWVMVGYSGWNAATYIAEEVREPGRVLPKALAAGAGLVAVLYLGLNLLFIYSTPIEKMKGVIAVGALSASNLFGPRAAGMFAALMAISIISTVSAMITIGPRVYYAMAKEDAFFSAAAVVHPRWRTPVVAIWCQGLCAIFLTMTPFPQLILYIGMSLTLFTVLSVASLFVFRRGYPDWRRLPAVDFAWPLVPGLYLLIGISMMIYGIVSQPKASFFALGTIALGALLWRFKTRGYQKPAVSVPVAAD